MGPELMIAGAVLGAVGQAKQSKGEQQQYKASAAAADYNARASEMEGEAEARRIRTQSGKTLGKMRSTISKSGVTMQGSPVLAMAESAEMGELDAATALWSATNESTLYRGKAASERRAARTAKKALPFAIGSSLLTGAGNYAAATA